MGTNIPALQAPDAEMLDCFREGVGRVQLAGAKKQALQKQTLSETAVKGFLAIADLWGFSNDEKVASLGLSNFKELKNLEKNPVSISKDQMDKISFIFCIYDDLRTLLGDGEHADNWFRQAEEKGFLLGDKTPLQHVLSGKKSGIEEVCRYLTGVRHF